MPVVRMPDGALVNFPDDMPQEEIKGLIASKFPDIATRSTAPEKGLLDTFGGGVSRGLSRLGSTFTDIIPAMAGSAIGADEYAQEQFAEAAEKQRVSELFNPTQFASYKDVEGIGDFTRFVGETIGEQVGNLGLITATALTGGALAPAAVGARVGQLAGAGFGSYALNAPEIFENIYRETGETAPGTALIFGAGAAALDSVLPAALARNISGPMKAGVVTKLLERSGMQPGVLRSGTAGLFSGLGVEGITEGAQEGISIAAERFIDDNPDVFGSKEFDRIMEASVRGAVAGGGFGTVGGGVEGSREKSQIRLKELEESQKLQAELDEKVKQERYGANAEEATENYVAQFATALSDVEQQTPQETTRPSPAEEFAQAPTFDPTGLQAEAEAGVALDQAVSAGIADQDAAIQTAVDRTQTTPSATPSDAELFIDDTAQFDAFGQPIEPEVVSDTVIPTDKEGLKNWGKNNFGIGHSAAVLRENGPLAGKDLSDPAQAAEVQAILTTVKDKSTSATIPGRIDEFLKRSEFEAAPTVQEQVTKAAPSETTETTETAVELVVEPSKTTKEVDTNEGANPQLDPDRIQNTLENAGYTYMPEFNNTRQALDYVKKNGLSGAGILVRDDTKVVAISPSYSKPAFGTRAGSGMRYSQKTFKDGVQASEVVEWLGNPSEAASLRGESTPDANLAKKTTTKRKPKSPSKPTTSFADELAGSTPLPQQARETETIEETEETEITKETETTDQTDVPDVFDRRGKSIFNKPTYQGKALNQEQQRIAERGNFRQLLSSLIKSQPKEIQQVLRKIRSQGLATKLVIGATPEGTSGYYDAGTDTIVLNPQEGLTEETFLHEATHAALAQALNNPDLQITKDFFKFYSGIKDQMGDMYGGQDLQEFAAELVSNPEFQALLKDTKAPNAPASKNLFRSIMEAIARFFGFRPQQTAYDKGLDFIDKVLDVSQGVEPTLFDRLLLGTPQSAGNALRDAIRGVPTLAGRNKERVLDTLSRSGELMSRGMGVLRMHDFAKLFAGTELGRVAGEIRDTVLQRQATVEKKIKKFQNLFRKYNKLRKEHPQDWAKVGKIAGEARRNAFDLVNVDGKEFNYNKLTAEQKAKFNNLKNQLNNLHPDVQAAYKEMRAEYRAMYNAYKKTILDQADASKRKDLENEFTRTNSAVGYVPFLRHGAYFLEFNTQRPDGKREREVVSFESPRQRSKFIQDNNISSAEIVREFKNLENATYNPQDHLSSSFVFKLMDSTNPNLNAAAKDAIYQSYLAVFPEHSFMQRLRRAKLTPGEEQDLASTFGDTMVKWARKEAALEYVPKLNEKFMKLGKVNVANNKTQEAAKEEIFRRQDFTLSPNYSKETSFFATSAYNLFLFGNISSAVVNLSAVPLLTMPLLGGQYGYAKANAAIARAMKVAMPSMKNLDKDTYTFENLDWTNNDRYSVLKDTLDMYGQREHTMQREILEGAKQTAEDYSSGYAKAMNLGSLPFTEAEKYSRATSAIAAYELALDAGKSQKVAAEEAVKLTMDVHTSGIAAEGPGWLQNGFGRVMWTFKTFIWNSASITAQAMNASLRGESAEVRKQARKQVLGIYMVSGALAGVNGLPFFGAAATFANIANALLGDDEEPFNARDLSREFMGDFLFKGPLNYATNLEISNRVGIANGLLFREDPYSVEQNGLLMTAVMQSTGPVGSFALNLERNVPKQLERGEYLRAIESMSPSGLRNLFKTTRFAQEGARTANGQPIMEDFNGFQLALQSLGFTPAELSNLYENRAAALNFQSKVRTQKQKILKQYYLGVTTGDRDLQRKALADYKTFARNFPSLVNEDTLTRSFKSRAKSEQELLYGIKFDKKLLPDIEERFFDD